MFKLLMNHTELKCLSWSLSEFSKLVADGSVRRPNVWQLTLQVKLLGKVFYIPLAKVV